MSLPGSSSAPAESSEKRAECAAAGQALLYLLEHDIKPRDIMTKKSFENAMTVIMATGGSTNAVLHLLAMAHAVGVDLVLDDFQRVSVHPATTLPLPRVAGCAHGGACTNRLRWALAAGERCGAVYRRPQTKWQVRDGGPARSWRDPRRDEAPA
jgi:hypothetical protein